MSHQLRKLSADNRARKLKELKKAKYAKKKVI